MKSAVITARVRIVTLEKDHGIAFVAYMAKGMELSSERLQSPCE